MWFFESKKQKKAARDILLAEVSKKCWIEKR